jgi:hypothetical protein
MHQDSRGTATNGEPSLCLTCRFATVVKGTSLRDEIVECSQLSYGETGSRFRLACARSTPIADSRRFVRWRRFRWYSGPIRRRMRSDS